MLSICENTWHFWVDRGGTFTDIVARTPEGSLLCDKLLSENPGRYGDAVVFGIGRMLAGTGWKTAAIQAIRMGTTVGTNALLERKGEPTALITNQGLGDALRIGYQNRPAIFALGIRRPPPLYDEVAEIGGRIDAGGNELEGLDRIGAQRELSTLYAKGIRSLAIVLMHAWKNPAHELMLGDMAREMGFTQVSLSHQVSPSTRLIGRGDTAVLDAYLSPLLRRYVNQIASDLSALATHTGQAKPALHFMQSNGGLTSAGSFRGKDCVLSGPAGGIVGAVSVARQAGFRDIIAFDMGGTSTDVAHYAGEYERQYETEVAGVRIHTPMLSIHTVAAGGGSVLAYDGVRLRVGPESAGADPGPACYRRGGPLCLTDANVLLGKIQADHFPAVFGPAGDQAIDTDEVLGRFTELAVAVGLDGGIPASPQSLADGFVAVAVESMANAILKISVQRGFDLGRYALCAYGAAAGQHACLVAQRLGIDRILLHPLAGVLSAYGMGLADHRHVEEKALSRTLTTALAEELQQAFAALQAQGTAKLAEQGFASADISMQRRVNLRYAGSDTLFPIPYAGIPGLRETFEQVHRQSFGFVDAKQEIIVESISLELIVPGETPPAQESGTPQAYPAEATALSSFFSQGRTHRAPVYLRSRLSPGAEITGPALVMETHTTIVIESGWRGRVLADGLLLLTRESEPRSKAQDCLTLNPMKLEIFNQRFTSIAEQMGIRLQKTAHSVNIKERLDFSCAIFDASGDMVANAPHIPVHLGSMGDAVKALIAAEGAGICPGEAYLSNSPYQGGTHLPDMTVISPVWDESERQVLFYLAARGHHADIGGLTPGSMPALSRSIEEEGASTANLKILEGGRFQEERLRTWLALGPYPARNPEQNLADLRAQLAAIRQGETELRGLIRDYSLAEVQAYMGHIQDYGEEAVRRAIGKLRDGAFSLSLDQGDRIAVRITIDHRERSALIDFTGTSGQTAGNFNAPASVCKAAVLYVFRTLVDEPIPLNAGCLRPLKLVIPPRSLLNPDPPAAVVAGNVETSQLICDALYGALGVLAGSQGTMNNFTFGDQVRQYYETICGGAGAGADFDGCDAVHTHMTNSRITDPEVLELRFPVLLETFAIRPGSGGNGRHKGGNGSLRKIRFREPMSASIISSRRRTAPFGLSGGEPGQSGRNRVERIGGEILELEGCAQVEMAAGDLFLIETPGGGGFGTPDLPEDA